MLNYVRLYAQQGIKIFPCKFDKTPATPNGFYSAQKDIDILLPQFSNGKYLIGMPTGNTNGIVVIDIDINKQGDTRSRDEIIEALRELVPLPETLIVETPSGGWHLVYRVEYTNLSSRRRFFHHTLPVDIRANGGYVCAPDGDKYIVYDDVNNEGIERYRERCALLPVEIENFKPAYQQAVVGIVLSPGEIREIRSALAYLSSDDRDFWIRIGMALKSTNCTVAYGLWNEWSQKSEKYNASEMPKRWDGLKPNNIDVATIFYEAKKMGWVSTYEKNESKNTTINVNLIDKNKDKIEEKIKFPSELENPGGLVGDLIDFFNGRAIKQQPIFSLSAALCAVGALSGQKVETKTHIRTNLYIVNVGKSGCGKENVRRSIKKCFQEAGCGHLASKEDLASDASIITALQGCPSQIFLLDEIGRFLRTTNDPGRSPHLYNIVSVLLKLYSHSNQVFYGKSYADKDKQMQINQPNLCILGTTIPEALYRGGLRLEHVTDGFLSRTLIFETDIPNPRKVHRDNIVDITPPKLLEQLRALWLKKINHKPIGNVDFMEPSPQEVPLTTPASLLLQKFDDEIEEIRTNLEKQNRIDVVYNRSSEIAEQIALIIAVGNNINNPIITEKEMDYGIQLIKFLGQRMLFITENFIADNDYEHAVKNVLNIIRTAPNGQITFSKLVSRTQSLQNRIRFDILSTLTESEQVFEDWIDGENNKKIKVYIYNSEKTN